MTGSRTCWSRRAALQGVSAALLLRTAPAMAADKMTRAQAEYRDTPNGCKVVEGEVSKDGWCRAFALQD